MKALVYTGPEQLDYQDLDDPTPLGDEDSVLIKVDSVGICGSDMHAFLGHDARRPAPLVLGHEAAGIILEGDQAGRRVTVNPLVSCGQCVYCLSKRENLCPGRQIISMPPRNGAFADLLRMPAANLVTVPDNISLEQAALAEPISCGWHATVLGASALKMPLSDARVLVIGGGTIGVGAALSVACFGAKNIKVLEPGKIRREYLMQHGEINVIAPDELMGDEQFDLVFDCVGYEATRAQASRMAAPGGVIVHIGLGSSEPGLDVRRMTLQEITFIGTYTYTAQEFRDVAAAMFKGDLGRLDWTESRALSDGAGAFADIRAGAVGAPKIILKPN